MDAASQTSLSAIMVMARQGVWHPAPRLPEGFGKRLRLIRKDTTIIWLGIALVWALYFALLVYVRHTSAFGQLFCILTMYAVYHLRRRSASLRLQSLLVVPSPVAQYPVRAEFYANRRKYGSDFGVITFIDDFLVYAGFSTDFSFTRALLKDVDFPLEGKKRRQPFAPLPTGVLHWVTEDAEYELRLTVQVGIPGASTNPEPAFQKELHRWAASRGFANGNIFPPSRAKPESALAARRVAVAWQVVASLLTLGLLIKIYLTSIANVPGFAWFAGPFFLGIFWLVPMNFASISKALDGDLNSGAVFYARVSGRSLWNLATYFFKPRRWWVPVGAVLGPKPLVSDREWVSESPSLAADGPELAVLV